MGRVTAKGLHAGGGALGALTRGLGVAGDGGELFGL
jgi:hypothetical protein